MPINLEDVIIPEYLDNPDIPRDLMNAFESLGDIALGSDDKEELDFKIQQALEESKDFASMIINGSGLPVLNAIKKFSTADYQTTTILNPNIDDITNIDVDTITNQNGLLIDLGVRIIDSVGTQAIIQEITTIDEVNIAICITISPYQIVNYNEENSSNPYLVRNMEPAGLAYEGAYALSLKEDGLNEVALYEFSEATNAWVYKGDLDINPMAMFIQQSDLKVFYFLLGEWFSFNIDLDVANYYNNTMIDTPAWEVLGTHKVVSKDSDFELIRTGDDYYISGGDAYLFGEQYQALASVHEQITNNTAWFLRFDKNGNTRKLESVRGNDIGYESNDRNQMEVFANSYNLENWNYAENNGSFIINLWWAGIAYTPSGSTNDYRNVLKTLPNLSNDVNDVIQHFQDQQLIIDELGYSSSNYYASSYFKATEVSNISIAQFHRRGNRKQFILEGKLVKGGDYRRTPLRITANPIPAEFRGGNKHLLCGSIEAGDTSRAMVELLLRSDGHIDLYANVSFPSYTNNPIKIHAYWEDN